MGILAFMNKTQWIDGAPVTITCPAQIWWQHGYKSGAEILIASMHCAWFGFEDFNDNQYYEPETEYINPFFYMGLNSPEMKNDVGIHSNPKATSTSLQRSQSGDVITYTWGYNYSDVIFYVPKTNHSEEGFGFDAIQLIYNLQFLLAIGIIALSLVIIVIISKTKRKVR